MAASKQRSDLDSYRAKRSPGSTPEPFSSERAEALSRPRIFVVQKHAARHLHYDLRLEIAGALHSWALPKTPSLDPAVRAAAFETEDHPLEYADFEGIIPAGSYGAGAAIVWDRGFFLPLEDAERGLSAGKLLFELRGHKLVGLWELVRIEGKKDAKQPGWLLLKKPPGWALGNHYARDPRFQQIAERPAGAPPPGEESILSGLTVEELRQGGDHGASVRRELAALGAPRHDLAPGEIEVMKPEVRERPFTAAGWLFELKYDGFRVVAAREAGGPRLLYRSGRDATVVFPELARALAALPYGPLILDGEAVVLDETGRPSFQALQGRGLVTRKSEAERHALATPATLYLFDLLAFEGFDLRSLPLAKRKEILRRILPRAGPLRYTEDLEARGEDLYREVTRLGLEGMVGKRADSPYRGGRSADWVKVRADRVCDFAIVGWVAEATAGGTSINKLHLGLVEGARLVYAGRVGTGFSRREIDVITTGATRRAEASIPGAPRGPRHVWVEPELVCEVRFKEWTRDGSLRLPVFLRLRHDKEVAECVRQTATPAALEDTAPPLAEPPLVGQGPAAGSSPAVARGKRTSRRPAGVGGEPAFTNLDKVFWPAEGYTKGDLIAYYRAVSPWLLPYLADRPLVLDRYPDGIAGKSFFQKNAPDLPETPELKAVPVWSEGSAREIDAIVVDGLNGLLALANLGAIPLHVGASRITAPDRPDWVILDLDPKGAPFAHVIAIAQTVRRLTEEIGLPAFPKTSGGSGLHVLIPLGGQLTHLQSRQLAELLARVLVAELPALATIERTIGKRGGRVYVDFLQNGRGKLIAGPLSVRPLPGAPVSTPLHWEEVDSALDPKRFTIKTVLERLHQGDPLQPVLELAPDVGSALDRLARRV